MRTVERRICRGLVCAICLVVGLFVAVPTGGGLPSINAAHAQPAKTKEEAGRRFKKGFELFKEADYEAALIEFRRAYELVPNYAVLYNIGQVYFQLQDYAGALKTFEQYLDEGGAKVSAKRRKQVESDIEKLKSRVANVTITTNVDGANISVDDISVGVAPLGDPVLVSAGRRRISAEKDGLLPARKVIDVAGEEDQTVALELREISSGDGPREVVFVEGEGDGASETPDEPRAESGGSVPWAAWGLTGGFAVATGVFAIVAVSSESSLTDKRDEAPSTADDLDAAAAQTTAFAIVTDVFLAATVITAGISVYLTIDALSEDDAETDIGFRVPGRTGVPQRTVVPRRTVQLGAGPGSVQLRGTF